MVQTKEAYSDEGKKFAERKSKIIKQLKTELVKAKEEIEKLKLLCECYKLQIPNEDLSKP